ncbi:MAG: hypothetical protein PHX47_02560 [Candidatus ainarchaeum sp.]|jgi:hypothetical protein|nr:hypothetical protein [Candidatus ainarchaeum sp.]
MKIRIYFLDCFDKEHKRIIRIDKKELKNLKNENGFLSYEVLK